MSRLQMRLPRLQMRRPRLPRLQMRLERLWWVWGLWWLWWLWWLLPLLVTMRLVVGMRLFELSASHLPRLASAACARVSAPACSPRSAAPHHHQHQPIAVAQAQFNVATTGINSVALTDPP